MALQRFVVTIEGPGFTDVQEAELHALPENGELIETKLGTCVVRHAEASANGDYAGSITCRLP